MGTVFGQKILSKMQQVGSSIVVMELSVSRLTPTILVSLDALHLVDNREFTSTIVLFVRPEYRLIAVIILCVLELY